MLESQEKLNFNESEIDGGLGKLVYESCSKHGDKIFQFCADTKKSETFISYRNRSVRVAIEMRKRGIHRGDVVMSCSPNTLDSPLFLAATFYLGATPTALDPTLSSRDCAYFINLVKPKLVFFHEDCVDLLESALEINGYRDVQIAIYGTSVKYPQFSEYLKESEEEANFKPVYIDNLHDTCWILFSSGTSGLAKGICLSHIAVYGATIIYESVITDMSVQAYSTTLYWVSAATFYVNQIMRGNKRILRRANDAETLMKTISEYKVTFSFAAPFFAYKIADLGDLVNYDLSSLSEMVFGGGPMTVELIQLLRKRLGNTFCVLGYGMTKASGPVSVFAEKHKDLSVKYPNSSGKVTAGIAAKFVDLETGKVLGPNKTGELRIKCKYGMNGYLGRDTALDYDSEGFFKTGDVGYYNEEGCIFINDRIKDMFKYLSWHIVPASIEGIIREHPAVQEVVVFGSPHDRDGEIPTAAIVVKSGCKVTSEEIVQYVAERVVDRQRLRGGVYILKEIPKTPTGKLLRRQTKEFILGQNQNMSEIE